MTLWTAELISFVSIFAAMVLIHVAMKGVKYIQDKDITHHLLQIWATFLLQNTKYRYSSYT